MSSALRNSLFTSVKARLTVFSGIIIALSALAVYLFVYGHLSRTLQSNIDQYLSSELIEFHNICADGGLEALRHEVQLEEHSQGSSRIFMRVFDNSGNELMHSDISSWGDAAAWSGPVPDLELIHFQTLNTARDGVEARRIEGHAAPDVFVVMGVTNEQNKIVLQTFGGRFLEVFILVLAFSLLGAWLIARHAMRGVEVLTVAAEEIAGGALNRRITGHGFGYEIDRLASVFNRMLEKIAALIMEARTLTDNIAHELRSPLTRIRGNAEAAATNRTASLDCRELASTVVEECDGLLSIVNSMLTISQIEAGLAKMDFRPVNVAQLIRESCDLFAPLAEDRAITLRVNVDSEVSVRGDSVRLHQALANLLDNALKYTPANGTVSLSLEVSDGHAVMLIEDNGIGIAEKDLPHIFERFYRSDTIRAMPGNGLGLGLVHAIVTAHGGTITVSSSPGTGTTFKVFLPTD